MLYVDSSALVKRFVREAGSEELDERLQAGDRIYTSALSYAEILSALSRKHRSGQLAEPDFKAARTFFFEEWASFLNILPVDTQSMSFVIEIMDAIELRASDAIHLSSALYLAAAASKEQHPFFGPRLEFAVCGLRQARAATAFGLLVFNPEAI